MFGPKYIFETKRTRLIRTLLNIGIGIAFVFAFIVFIGVYIPFFSKSESENSEQAFYKKDPAIIAVYTGDSGRINYALDLARRYKTSKILISGVYQSNTIQTLLQNQVKESDRELVQQIIDTNRIEIDHVAKNTIENVFSTFHYLRNTHTQGDVLIVSNDYHIMRIKLIVNMINNEKDKLNFYYKGMPTDYKSLRNIKILYREVTKYIKAFVFLILWDTDNFKDINLEAN